VVSEIRPSIDANGTCPAQTEKQDPTRVLDLPDDVVHATGWRCTHPDSSSLAVTRRRSTVVESPSRNVALPVLSSEAAGRREVVRSIGALSAALLSALGLREVAAKRGQATGESHRQRDGHPHGKRGKRGEAGPGGPAGSPGSQGAKGDKGDNGDAGNQGDKGDKGDKGDSGTQGEPSPTAGKMSWARVGRTGNVIGSYGVDTVSYDPRQNSGSYGVHFTDTNQNYNVCAITGLSEGLTLFHARGGTGSIFCQTTTLAGILVDAEFSCIVVCPAT
jgi:hypothetical protein